MGAFTDRLTEQNQGKRAEGRRWIFVPYDQLTDQCGPLAETDPGELAIVLVESPWKAGRRPYHQQKLLTVLANLRHFALEQAARGVLVRHVVHDGPYTGALRPVIQDVGALEVMRPAERELREDLQPLFDEHKLTALPHAGWLTTRDDFIDSTGDAPPWRMDSFYRHVRQRTGILMDDGDFVGGKLSFDDENREPWRGEPEPPEVPRFEVNAVTREVADLIERAFSDHPGRLDPGAAPVTQAHAQALWQWAKDRCLPHFGPYEDAMSRTERSLFHTRISPLVNLHRLLPRQVVDDVLGLSVPLNCREGFVRQVLGWREFVRHVHEITDGFRDPGAGDLLDRTASLPPAFWGEPSGLHCLDTVVADVWDTGYGHHITRLMVLSNIATLLDLSARELTDWFWEAYVDAYDWVVEPNVLAMGSFATDVMTTKPYVSGANYIHKMSDFCEGCDFHPKKTCPLTPMYWAFLNRHRKVLSEVGRMNLQLASAGRRSADTQKADRDTFERVQKALSRGERLRPQSQSSSS